MKIIYLASNQAKLAADGSIPDMRVSTDSAMVRHGNPLFLPDFEPCWQGEVMPAVRICRLGLGVLPQFAGRYYDAFTLMHHLLPGDAPAGDARFGLKDVFWAHDGAFAPGQWTELPESGQMAMAVDGGAPSMVDLRAADQAVAAVSRFMTIKTGDIIVLADMALPTGPLRVDTAVSATADDKELLRLRIK